MNSEVLDKLTALDAAGFLITEDESAEEFLQRVEDTEKVYAEFEEKLASGEKAEVFDMFEVSAADRISAELAGEAAGITMNLYGFSVSHVPGFYLTRQIGLLWGGCLIGDPEQNFAVFLLRNAFRRKRRFLNYRREELLAHELCHAVRHVMEEPELEEYFAYQTSPSPLRRYLGNCFISDKDALGFLLPVLLLPAAELLKALWIPGFPTWIFWVSAVIYPLYLLARNQFSRLRVGRARKVLREGGISACEAVLFRMTPEEMDELSGCEDVKRFAAEKAEKSIRWKVITERFFKRKAAVKKESFEE